MSLNKRIIDLIEKYKFEITFVLILIIAFFLRFYRLDLRILHHDEAVNYISFIQPIIEKLQFTYYPDNFHGPLTYFLSSIIVAIFGKQILFLRFTSALFGSLLVGLIYFLKNHFGKSAVIICSLFLAISPTMTYFSRYLISFQIYLFFLLLSIIFFLKFFKDYKVIFLILSSISLGLTFVTNEALYTFIFIAASFFYLNYLFDDQIKNTIKSFFSKLDKKDILLLISLFIIAVFFLQTSFLKNFENILQLFKSIFSNTEKSYNTGHNKEFLYYFKLIFHYELLLFITLITSFIFTYKTKLEKFIFYWSIANLFLLSIIPYKTSWLLTIVIFPLFLLAGINFSKIFNQATLKRKIYLNLFIGIILIFTLSVTIYCNFIYPNNETKNALAYVQTTEQINVLINDIQEYAKTNQVKILIAANAFEPLGYYLSDYENFILPNNIKFNLNNYNNYNNFIINNNQIDKVPGNFEAKEYELRQNYFIKVLYENEK
jgi:uncharacterized protein (TIGR03663 family)